MSFWPTQACTIPKVIILKLRECSWGAGSIIIWIIIKANVWNTPVRNPLLGPLASKTEAFEASEHIIKLVIVTIRVGTWIQDPHYTHTKRLLSSSTICMPRTCSHWLFDHPKVSSQCVTKLCWTLYPQQMTSTRLQWQVCPSPTISWLALPTQPSWLPIHSPAPAPLSSGKRFILDPLKRLGHLEDFLPRCPQEAWQPLQVQATGGMTTLDQLTKPVPTKPQAAMPDEPQLRDMIVT